MFMAHQCQHLAVWRVWRGIYSIPWNNHTFVADG